MFGHQHRVEAVVGAEVIATRGHERSMGLTVRVTQLHTFRHRRILGAQPIFI